MKTIPLILTLTALTNTTPHLVIHLDVNRTIIAIDSTQGNSLETTINGIITEGTYHTWDGATHQSYYNYVTDCLMKEMPGNSRASDIIKKARTERLKGFPDYLKVNHPALYPIYKKERSALMEILSGDDLTIFPSCYRLIEWINQSPYKNNYSLYLRTFGTDINEVVPLLEKHADIKFAGSGQFKNGVLHINDQTIQSTADLYQFFSSEPGTHYAIQDDYFYWRANKFSKEGGKLFPIDHNDKEVVAIFFDDNADDPDRDIICPIHPDGTIIHPAFLLKTSNIVAVDRKKVILNENYLIEKIQKTMPSNYPIVFI